MTLLLQSTARWTQINYKKGASKIPSKSIISYPNRYVLWQKKIFCHRIRYSKFFLKFFHKKLVETTVCGAILTPVMGFYGSWPMFQNVWRPQLCTKGNNIELLLVKIGPESNNKRFRSLEWLYVLMYQLWTVCGAISTPVMGFYASWLRF